MNLKGYNLSRTDYLRDYQRVYYKKRYATDPVYREKIKAKGRKYFKDHPDRNRKQSAKWVKDNPEKYLCMRAKQRARLRKLPFDLVPEDIKIPQFCPVLGMRMEIQWGHGAPKDNSPSIDRIIPSLGYVKSNIIIVSQKANQMKSNGTVEELGKVYEFYRDLGQV